LKIDFIIISPFSDYENLLQNFPNFQILDIPVNYFLQKKKTFILERR